MIIGQINVRIAFKCPHSPTGRDNGLRNHPVRVRIPVKAQFPAAVRNARRDEQSHARNMRTILFT